MFCIFITFAVAFKVILRPQEKSFVIYTIYMHLREHPQSLKLSACNFLVLCHNITIQLLYYVCVLGQLKCD